MELLKLAEECERAEWRDHDPGYPERLGVRINEALEIASYITDAGNPVLSIDAALTLVPEGHGFVVHGPSDGRFWAGCSPADWWGDASDLSAATPALALTAAALRARAAQ